MSKLAIVGGLAGVGKTTVLDIVYRKLTDKGVSFNQFVYGSVMLAEAEKLGIKDRDMIRKLPYEKQVELQRSAAEAIRRSKADVVIVDTHFQILTPYGYLPGIPIYIAQILSPTHLFLITAPAEIILKRRASDPTRKREIVNVEEIERELEYARMYMIAVSELTGAVASEVVNEEGKPESAAEELIKRLGLE
ncbi:MAG: adenylate kinase [Nitrososphaeria archaeon]